MPTQAKPRARPKPAAKMPVSDAAVQAKTGCTWDRWITTLDRAGAAEMSHREIAQLVRDRYHVGDWWCQMVTVGYERARGLRAVNETAKGFAAGTTRTIAASSAKAFRAWTDARARAAWLPRQRFTIRTSIRPRSLRITWPDGADLEVVITAKGANKCVVAVTHGKLKSAPAVRGAKAYWAARLDALRAELEA
jgi:hypothetical protein